MSTYLFPYPKWQRKLKEAVETTQPESSIHKFKDLCRTRPCAGSVRNQQCEGNNVEKHHGKWFAEVEELWALTMSASTLWMLASLTQGSSTVSITILLTYHLHTSVRLPTVGNGDKV